MSTYFVARPSRIFRNEEPEAHAGHQETTITLDLHQSIYLFPNPSTAPPSPSGTSLSSIPSDFSPALSELSSPSTRERSLSIPINHTRNGVGARYGSDQASTSSHQLRSDAEQEETDIEVEVWDWNIDTTEYTSFTGDSSELEAEIERISRWDAVRPYVSRRPWPIGNPPQGAALETLTPRPFHPPSIDIAHIHRIRTQSNISFASSLSSALSSRLSAMQKPHPRIHIPLLSFIASLFSLDLDDPALRLLTTSTSDSILFPGQAGLLEGDDPGCIARHEAAALDPTTPSQDDNAEEVLPSPRPHGFLALCVLSDDSRLSVRSLKEGLRVICTPVVASLPSPPVPRVPGFSTVYNAVTNVFSRAENSSS